MKKMTSACLLALAVALPVMPGTALAFDMRASIPSEDTAPQSNDWRGLGQDADVTTVYSAKAVNLFSDAVRSLSNLFSDDHSWRTTLNTVTPTRLLTDLHGSIGGAAQTAYLADDYEAPAQNLGVLGDLATTIWLEQEDRTLDPEADSDLAVDRPWQLGIKVNMPF